MMEEFAGVGIGAGLIVRGRVVHQGEDGLTTVVYEDGSEERCAVLEAAGARFQAETGDAVLVWRGGGEGGEAVVLGRIARGAAQQATPDELVIEAKKNLTLKCGDGSITIREDGKVLIKGKDLVSHARRANRIRGGSVAIN